MEKVIFSVCLSVHTLGAGGLPQSQVLSQVSSSRSFLAVPQSQVFSQVSGPRSFLGGYPRPVHLVSHTGVPPSQDWGTSPWPLPGTGYAEGGMPRFLVIYIRKWIVLTCSGLRFGSFPRAWQSLFTSKSTKATTVEQDATIIASSTCLYGLVT